MMESNLKESLLAGSSPPDSSSPSRTAASASDDDSGKTDGTPPLVPPSSSPSLPAHRAKNGTSPSSPSSPCVENANIVKNLSPPPAESDAAKRSSESKKLPVGILPDLSTSPSLPVASDADDHPSNSGKPPGELNPSTSPSPAALGSAPSTALGPPEDSTTARNPLLTSPRNSLLAAPSSSSSPPASRGWQWLGLRRRPPGLPVYAPPPAPAGRSYNWFHEWKETNRPKGPRVTLLSALRYTVFLGNSVLLDSVGVEKVIGIFGFSLFGSISLVPSTMDRISANKLPDLEKTILMGSFALIWIAASAGVLCGLHGKTDFEQAVCRHTGRLSMLGLVLLVILHVRWALPAGDDYDTGCYVLVGMAFLLHFGLWVSSLIVGEDKMEDAAPADAQQ